MLNLVELGAGDWRKTSLRFHAMNSAGVDFTHIPIDVSCRAMTGLCQGIRTKFEGSMKIHVVVGDCLQGLNWVRKR